jgi:hypothetical protein
LRFLPIIGWSHKCANAATGLCEELMAPIPTDQIKGLLALVFRVVLVGSIIVDEMK